MSTDDFEDYVGFTRRARIDRDLHQMEGILRGLTVDDVIRPKEVGRLRAWAEAIGPLRNRPPYDEVIGVVERVVADGVIDEEELQDLQSVLARFTTPNEYYDAVTSDIQRFHGLIRGILADGVLHEEEIRGLRRWMMGRKHLRYTYPYSEVMAVLSHVLADGSVTRAERNLLIAVMEDHIDRPGHRVVEVGHVDIARMSLRGICVPDPVLRFDGKRFCFTGRCKRKKRSELMRIVSSRGGVASRSFSLRVDYLVIGAAGNPCWAFSCYGRKIEKALQSRRRGNGVLLVHEEDFLAAS